MTARGPDFGLLARHRVLDIRTATTADGRPASERFWSYVDRRGPDECWLWMRGPYKRKVKDSYGIFYVRQVQFRSNCAAFVLGHGVPVPSGMCVRHVCDNPRCCNPAHLILGTLADNNRDRAERGRSALGERSGKAVYTEEIVRKFRAMVAQGMSVRGAARAMGMSASGAASIATGRTWAHVGDETKESV